MLRNLQLGLSPIHHIHCWKKTTHQYHHHFLPSLNSQTQNWKTLPFGLNLAQQYSSQLSSRPTLQMSSKTQDSEGSSSARTISPPKVTHQQRIKFCQSCGGPTNYVVPDGEEKHRAVCSVCDKVYYENPKMVVGCLVEHNNKVLLCKRKIEPSYGLWTLPAGYLEIGESAAEGAARETLEEACAEVEVLSPFAQLDIPLIGQSYIIFHSKLKRHHFSPGPESLECEFFALEDIPYDSLAFSSVHVTLKMFTEDVKEGKVRFHYCTIIKRPGGGPSDTQGFTVGHHLCI